VNTGAAIAVALTFVWLGMVLAISFLEAPLKFRAPNVTLQIGLGIGRLVFRALNTVEVVFAIVGHRGHRGHRGQPATSRRHRGVRRCVLPRWASNWERYAPVEPSF
jgi:hypothetical protein